MKALVKAKAEKGLWMQDVEEPTLGDHEVCIKVKKAAICGTDLHIYNWDEWAQSHVKTPLIVGHEFTGEIVQVGKHALKFFKVGDRVSGEGHIACEHCRNCRSGRAHLCRHNVSVGVTRNGAFAEYIVIPSTNAYPIPANVSDSQAAILDPLGNATHTALSYDLVGEDVLITGAGPVGLLAAAVAKHVGARFVVITDTNEYRLKIAEKMGITLAVNPTKTSLSNVMKELGMKEGFDVGLEMSGNSQAFNAMIEHINHAGHIALLGFLPKTTTIDWSTVIMKGVNIKGIYGREMYDTWYKMITMLQSGLDIKPVITHEFAFADYEKAFKLAESGQAGKIVLNLG